MSTNILYNCVGKDYDSHRTFHCWITDRTIPLDVICAYDATIKSKCCLAAFCCILRAAHHGLYLSDCGFYNFGVIVSKDAKEHVVVIIDAGSRKISTHPQLKHSEMNLLFMRKFWVACRRESAVDDNIVHMWQNPKYSSAECLRRATKTWQSSPILTARPVCTVAILKEISVREKSHAGAVIAKPAYKVMEIVARFTAQQHWNAPCALICYRWSETLEQLSSEENNILQELYERITFTRPRDREVDEVMQFWNRLNEFEKRQRWYMGLNRSDHIITSTQASRMLDDFKYYDQNRPNADF